MSVFADSMSRTASVAVRRARVLESYTTSINHNTNRKGLLEILRSLRRSLWFSKSPLSILKDT